MAHAVTNALLAPFLIQTHVVIYTHLYSPSVMHDSTCGFVTWFYLTQGHTFLSTHKPPAHFTWEVASSVVFSHFLRATTIWKRQTPLK